MRSCAPALSDRLIPVPDRIRTLPEPTWDARRVTRWMLPAGPPRHRPERLPVGTMPRRFMPDARSEVVRYYAIELFVAVGGPLVISGPVMIVPGLPSADAYGAPIDQDRVQVTASVRRVSGPAMVATLIIILHAEPVGGRGAVAVAALAPPGRPLGPGVSAVVDAMPGQLMRAEITIPGGGPSVCELVMSATRVPVAAVLAGAA